jgi:lipid-A-disaccharide synthase
MERRQGRDHQKYVDEMMVILPFEEDFYKKHGVHSHFVGHPLLDAISDLQDISIEGFKSENGLNEKEIIALLPDPESRKWKKCLKSCFP